nr:hypothetical protein [Mesobacterium pallidum]
MISAGLRAVLVAVVILLPSLVLPSDGAEAAQVVSLVAIVAAALTFVEYFATYPSIIEFRDARPFNRVRFCALALTVVLLTLACRDTIAPVLLTGTVADIGSTLGRWTDFPYSPVRMVVLMMPPDAPQTAIEIVRTGAGTAYIISLAMIVVFFVQVRLRDWPTRQGTFNVWVNLPLFDPTAGGDVLIRLKRDANVNIALGFLLPFLIPAIIKVTSDAFDPISITAPQTLVWTLSAWAFLPASLIVRGLALGRVAELIEQKRRRAYAKAEAKGEIVEAHA